MVKEGHDVKAACTKNALQFIGLATLEGFTDRPVYHDMRTCRRVFTLYKDGKSIAKCAGGTRFAGSYCVFVLKFAMLYNTDGPLPYLYGGD